jgi:lipopolysaccharide/colanic/teichoic acid biosynthesis glycosyltransferase
VEFGVKRLMDIVIAAAGLVALAPLMGAVALVVRATMGRPVLFRQVRPGLNARPFTLVKFRTMVGPQGHHDVTSDAQRVTRLGAFLRRTSIDELPELWNILKGEMSLVGPRPLLTEYLDRYTAEQARRHEVRPGLTGLAQVSGRHVLTWQTRFVLDVWYVDNWTLMLDLKILLVTIQQVVRGRDVVPATSLNYIFTGSTGQAREPEEPLDGTRER